MCVTVHDQQTVITLPVYEEDWKLCIQTVNSIFILFYWKFRNEPYIMSVDMFWWTVII
jgi:hypothetical protein